MIPEAKQPAVARALKEAFGVGEFEDIRRLTAGLTSALVFRIVVPRHPYLLRVITRTDDMSDPIRQFACMKSGAERGIAPCFVRKHRGASFDHGFRRSTSFVRRRSISPSSRHTAHPALTTPVPESLKSSGDPHRPAAIE
jgi:hypothetical protein